MSANSSRHRLRGSLRVAAVVALPVLCCAGPALLAAGALGVLGSWLLNPWLIGAAILLAVGVVSWRPRHRATAPPPTMPPAMSSAARPPPPHPVPASRRPARIRVRKDEPPRPHRVAPPPVDLRATRPGNRPFVEVREEACAAVVQARFLGFARCEYVAGRQAGCVLRSVWRADVALDPREPRHEIPFRRVVAAADVARELDIARHPFAPIVRRALRVARIAHC